MFPPYLFAYAETLRVEPAVVALRRIAAETGCRLWITGGTLRDVILARWPQDLDLAVEGDPFELGKRLAAEGLATFIPLDPASGTARAAIHSTQGINWIDMVALRASDIHGDLALRDVTINAIALPLDASFDDGSGTFIDPTGGREDLHRRLLRLARPTALQDDPARITRVYRLAAQLGFEIATETTAALRTDAALITRPASERISQELTQLLLTPDPSVGFGPMMDDGVMAHLFPALADGVGMAQNDYHHLDVWQHSLETVRQMAALLHQPNQRPDPAFDGYLADDTNRQTLMWAALLHDVGKPACRSSDDTGTHFYAHDQAGAKLVATTLQTMRLSKRLQQRTGTLVRNHLRPLLLIAQGVEQLTAKAADRLGRDLGDDLAGLFLLAIADARASLGPVAPTDAVPQLLGLWQRIDELRQQRILPVDREPPWLNGTDLITRFGVPKGPLVGQLLKELRAARIDGDISDRRDLKHWLMRRLKTLLPDTEKD